VASGYNVTIIIGTIITLIAGLIRRQWAILIGILAVFGYTIMAGAEPAIVRAAIMGSLAYFGQVLGKQSEGIRLLVVAGLTMILVNPFFLLDLGFQLSFMATLGLLLMADHFPQVIAETTAAQIMVWPIILINFGQLSLFSILVNILILWLVPYIMVLGAALALVGWIKPVGAVLGMIAYLPLHLMTVIINWFGEQSWISWQLEGVSWIFGALYYLILGAVLIKLNHVNPKKVV
jgi:competence protein ComEC